MVESRYDLLTKNPLMMKKQATPGNAEARSKKKAAAWQLQLENSVHVDDLAGRKQPQQIEIIVVFHALSCCWRFVPE